MTFRLLRTVGLVAVIALSVPLSAQSVPEWAAPNAPSAPAAESAVMPPQTPGGTGNAPTQVPLDGGLGLLALAGGALAVRKLRRA